MVVWYPLKNTLFLWSYAMRIQFLVQLDWMLSCAVLSWNPYSGISYITQIFNILNNKCLCFGSAQMKQPSWARRKTCLCWYQENISTLWPKKGLIYCLQYVLDIICRFKYHLILKNIVIWVFRTLFLFWLAKFSLWIPCIWNPHFWWEIGQFCNWTWTEIGSKTDASNIKCWTIHLMLWLRAVIMWWMNDVLEWNDVDTIM